MSDTPEKKLLISDSVKRYREHMGSVSPIKVAEMLGQPLHEIQQEIAKYFEKPLIHTWDNAVWLLSRRLGKSYLGIKIATTLMLTPESKILVCCHSTSLADVWFKDVLNDLMSIPSIKDKVVWGKKEGTIEIPELNTSFICCSYLNVASRIIGKSATACIYDEFFLVPEESQAEIFSLVTPTTANYGSNDGIKYAKRIILSTPRGTATGSQAGLTYLKGVNKEKGHLSFKYTIHDSPFLTKQEIEDIRQSTPESDFLQEYMVEFTKTSKTVFRYFDKKKHIIPLSIQQIKDMAVHCDFLISNDFGIIDGSGSTFALYHNKQDCYYVIDEFYVKDMVSYDYIKTVKAMAENWAKILDYPFEQIMWTYDPSALESARISSQSFNLTMHKAKNKRTEGVDFVNKMLQGKGDAKVPQLYFRDTCTTHIDMFEYAEFKVIAGVISNQFGKDPSARASHYECCVTTVYALYTHNKTSHSSFIIS